MTDPVEWLGSIGSTNEAAFERAASGALGPLWIAAEEQTGGRGRSGRQWVSPPGNLYSSHLLTVSVAGPVLAQLSLVAGVAVFDALQSLAPGLSLVLKWPNDVLSGAGKLSGVLIESRVAQGLGAFHVVIGIGINLAHHPSLPDRPATSLAALGYNVAPSLALRSLANAFASWREVWDEGRGFPTVRAAWLERGLTIGSEVSVKSGSDVLRGSFAGIDVDGAMLLRPATGLEQRITFGDVYVGAPPPAGT